MTYKNDTISSHVKIWYPHMWRYRWFLKFIGASSKHLPILLESLRQSFGNLRTSSEIFRNSRKMFGSVRLAFGTILENIRKSSESGRKSSENHQKRRHQYVYIIKRTLHVSSKKWILCSRGKNNILTRSLRSLVKYCSCHSNIKFISSDHLVISSISPLILCC